MKRLFVILALLGSPAYAVPVVPNFTAGGAGTVATGQFVTELTVR